MHACRRRLRRARAIRGHRETRTTAAESTRASKTINDRRPHGVSRYSLLLLLLFSSKRLITAITLPPADSCGDRRLSHRRDAAAAAAGGGRTKKITRLGFLRRRQTLCERPGEKILAKNTFVALKQRDGTGQRRPENSRSDFGSPPGNGSTFFGTRTHSNRNVVGA